MLPKSPGGAPCLRLRRSTLTAQRSSLLTGHRYLDGTSIPGAHRAPAPLVLLCLLASPANALTFQTRLERVQWQVEGDQFSVG